MTKEMIILGIDPGSTRVGFGLIKKGDNLTLVQSGLLNVTSRDKNQRLVEIEKEFGKILKKFKPDLAVMEKLFFMKNMKTALEVAQARGVLTLLILKYKIPLIELAPTEIKLAVAGHGLADKKAVSKMVGKILQIEEIKAVDDVTDAIAAAIAGYSYLKIHNFF